MTYELNQIIEFINEYPEGLYQFVIENDYTLTELEPITRTETVEDEDGNEQQIEIVVRRVQIVEIPQETPEQRRQRINMLSLTKREVFLALYRDKGLTPDQIRASITNPEALIEFDYATEYYRGNPLIDAIGLQLGYTTEDLDYLFINGELPA